MNIADELLTLVKRDDIGDFNRVTEIMDILNNQEKLEGKDFNALDQGKQYVTRMQKLLGRQN